MTTPRTTRSTATPAYYLGRPAAAWQLALRRHHRPSRGRGPTPPPDQDRS
jgi:hypothetical protein